MRIFHRTKGIKDSTIWNSKKLDTLGWFVRKFSGCNNVKDDFSLLLTLQCNYLCLTCCRRSAGGGIAFQCHKIRVPQPSCRYVTGEASDYYFKLLCAL